MLPDLKRLIQLQQLDNTAADAQRVVDAIPSRIEALDAELTARTAAVDEATGRLDDRKSARAAVEKTLAAIQTRLSRFREQLMAVKTNKEYTAMQHEIATAEADVQRHEDTILEHMLELDDLAAALTTAQQALSASRKEIEKSTAALAAERGDLEHTLGRTAAEHDTLLATIGAEAQALFNRISKQRNGIAVVEARDGLCLLCNVRLRPQVFNHILQNTELVQCDSCNRILYHDPNSKPAAAPAVDAP
ncbi:MAG: C4-type zinc ribbon domain-containing protein [Vicinamibacterales bacterium]|nr:C4-type zinc ribbon domain-containing protein [Vicinamibacterales bacterium]